MSTSIEKYAAVLTDLIVERAGVAEDSCWAVRLDFKLAELRATMTEKFGANYGVHLLGGQK